MLSFTVRPTEAHLRLILGDEVETEAEMFSSVDDPMAGTCIFKATVSPLPFMRNSEKAEGLCNAQARPCVFRHAPKPIYLSCSRKFSGLINSSW